MELNKYWKEQFAALEEIASITDMNFAQHVATALNPRKHMYSSDVYIALLGMVRRLIQKGTDPETALDAVQTGWELHKILEVLNESKNFDRAAV